MDEEEIPLGTDDISVALNDPPRASVLSVPLGITSPPDNYSYPYVASADDSGLILLCSTHPLTTFSSLITYHICDAHTGEVFSLRWRMHPMGFHGKNVGLVTRGDD